MEVAVVLVVVAMIGAGLSRMMSDNAKQTRSNNIAEKLTMITDASQRYLSANRAALLTATGGGNVVAIPAGKDCPSCAQPAAPAGLSTIQAAGFLPSSFVDFNSAQQSHALLVRQTASGDLDAIVTTYGGRGVEDSDIGYISGRIGAAGGGVFNNASLGANDEIMGSHGGWGDDTSNWNASIGGTSVTPSPGNIQVSMGLAAISSGGGGVDETQFLHRSFDSTTPSLNGMNTDLSMNGNDILMGAGNIASTGTIAANTVSSPNVNGTTLTASSQLNAPRWRDSNDGKIVDPSGNSTFNNIAATQVTAPTVNATTVTAGRFVDSGGATWVLDPDGSSRLNDVTATTLEVTGATTLGTTSTGALTASGVIRGPRFVDSDNTSRIMDPSGTSDIQNIIIRGTSTIDGATTLNGALTSTAAVNAPRIIASDRMESPQYMTSSDRRLKEDIKDLDGMAIIDKLAGKSYTLKANGKVSMGFIAQDIEEHLPFVVATNPDTGMKSVNYIELIAPMADAIQQLSGRLDALER